MLKRLHTVCLVLSAMIGTTVAMPAHAALVDGNVGEISGVFTYNDYGGGDVVIEVQTPLPTCQNGFWLRPTDPGFKTLYAHVLTAYTSKLPLRIGGWDDQIWAGSSGRYCRIYFIGTPY